MIKKPIIAVFMIALVGIAYFSVQGDLITGALRKKKPAASVTQKKKAKIEKKPAAEEVKRETNIPVEPIATKSQALSAPQPFAETTSLNSDTSNQAFFLAQTRQQADEHYTEERNASNEMISLLHDILETARSIEQKGLIEPVSYSEPAREPEVVAASPPVIVEAPPAATVQKEEPKLIAHYTFDEVEGSDTAVDASGNDLHGKIYNGATRIPGVLKSALSFDGVDDYVLVMSNDLLNMSEGRDFSFSLWLKKGDKKPLNTAFLISRGAGGVGDPGYALELSNNRVPLALLRSKEGMHTSLMKDGINDQEWHHIAVISDRDGLQKMYIDGAYRNSIDISALNNIFLGGNSHNLAFGSYAIFSPNNPHHFIGSLDDIRFYEGVLSDKAVLDMYAEGQKAVLLAQLENIASSTCNVIETEAATLTLPFIAVDDEQASGGKYVIAPEANGANNNGGRAAYKLTIAQAGVYRIWARIHGPGGDKDSFFASVDGSPDYTWDLNAVGTWGWNVLSNRGVKGSDQFQWNAGEHTILLKSREDGAKIDKFVALPVDAPAPEGLGPPGCE